MSEQDEQKQNKKIVLLILDDDEDTLLLMRIKLHEGGVDYFEMFTHSQDLLDNLTDEILVLLLDYRLVDEERNGLDVLYEARKKNDWLYSIIVTGLDSPELVNAVINAKADKSIFKDRESKYLDALAPEVTIGLKEAEIRRDKKIKEKEIINDLQNLMKK